MNKSVIRAIDMLELIAGSSNPGMTLSEIAREMDMPVAGAGDIIKALLSKNMPERRRI